MLEQNQHWCGLQYRHSLQRASSGHFDSGVVVFFFHGLTVSAGKEGGWYNPSPKNHSPPPSYLGTTFVPFRTVACKEQRVPRCWSQLLVSPHQGIQALCGLKGPARVFGERVIVGQRRRLRVWWGCGTTVVWCGVPCSFPPPYCALCRMGFGVVMFSPIKHNKINVRQTSVDGLFPNFSGQMLPPASFLRKVAPPPGWVLWAGKGVKPPNYFA